MAFNDQQQRMTCDSCGIDLSVVPKEERASKYDAYENAHWAIGGLTTPIGSDGKPEFVNQDWDPEPEYDLCDECNAAAWNALMSVFLEQKKKREEEQKQKEVRS